MSRKLLLAPFDISGDTNRSSSHVQFEVKGATALAALAAISAQLRRWLLTYLARLFDHDRALSRNHLLHLFQASHLLEFEKRPFESFVL